MNFCQRGSTRGDLGNALAHDRCLLQPPTEEIDLEALSQKSATFTAINPFQRVPALVLDDGTVIAESIAICRYIEWLRPDPVLFGRSGIEAALIEMWERRIEHYLFARVTHVFRHLHPAMKAKKIRQVVDTITSKTAERKGILDALRGCEATKDQHP